VIDAFRKAVGDNADLALIALVVGILTILFVPVPTQVLDLLLIANLSFALLVLLITFYTLRPVEFSTFPSLLLIATLFRLALNIAATRLILSQADAGKVISAVGSYVVAGNYVTGLIVFLILVVVQYVVVTNGAQRVAEVAARFTLDSMPGQQMAIDADLNMGFIDQKQAQERRKLLEREANFYGAMDGASKFVKGDAIAGILILLINIVGGLAIGVFQLGMPWRDAVQTYTLLTIGDGIVTQIPALIISIGTGIIITRSASDARLSAEISRQFTNYPKTLLIVLAALCLLVFLPGIPVWPFLVIGPIVAAMAYLAMRRKLAGDATASAGKDARKSEDEDLYGTLAVEPLEVRVGQNLIALVGAEGAALMDRIIAFRRQYAQEAGVVVPKVRIRDEKRLRPNGYEVCIFGVPVGSGELLADRTLAIHAGAERRKLQGVETRDPTYGLPAIWIAEGERQAARGAGYTLVDPTTVLVTHLGELLKRNVATLLTRVETERLIDRLRAQHAGLIDELIPNIMTLGEVQKVLQNLLREKVSVRHLDAILEVLADAGRSNKNADSLTELVRQRLGLAICQGLTDATGSLYVLTLDPAIEHTISSSLRGGDEKAPASLILEPRFAEQVLSRIGAQVERMLKNNVMPVLLCSPELRRHLRRLTERVLPHLAVLSMTEVPNNMSLKSFGVVTI
jgi:flagellar biosynthesis protein FlhA